MGGGGVDHIKKSREGAVEKYVFFRGADQIINGIAHLEHLARFPLRA